MDPAASLETVATVADCAALLGEGPVWIAREGALYWVDIKAPLVWRWQEGELRHWTPPFRVTALAPRRNGGFIAATDRGFALIDLEQSRFELIGNPEPELPGNRFNDGKTDRAGRFWAGTMDDEEAVASGSLYRLESDLHWSRIDEGYRVTNGPAFSAGGDFLYHSDSARRTVYRFAIGADGAPLAREPFLQFEEVDGFPDGMTVDAENCLWIAFWDGWCVRRFGPGGEPIARIPVPVQRPTSCAFGGAELDRLFITSARVGLDAQALAGQPLAGALLAVDPGVRGLPETEFAG